MIAALLAVLGCLAIASLVPSPWRTPARVGLALFVLLTPLWALAIALSRSGRAEPGTWLLFLPATFVYLAVIDLRYGVSARLARIGTVRPERASSDPRANGA